MNQNNGKHRSIALADFVEDNAEPEQTTTFYDSNTPELKPAKSIDTGKKKNWKRKLIGWSLVLILVFGGAVALYLLLRVNRVNVRVDADSRRDPQSAKPNANSKTTDNTLTSEAIDIARAASGADSAAAKKNNTTSSGNAAPTPTPSPDNNVRTNYSFTGNSSPVFDRLNDDASNRNENQQQTGGGNQTQEKTGNLTTPAVAQNHPNSTQSLVVEDLPARTATASQLMTATPARLESKPAAISLMKTPPAVLPPFGTLLPVRTQGVIFTLRNNSYARLELTRDAAGTGWLLPKGTVLVGRTMGSEETRAFVNVIGYIDPRDNKLVKMSGDVLGSDGAAGIPGRRLGVDRNRLKQTLRKVASHGVQVAGLLGGALGRGTVILDASGYSPYDLRGRSGSQDQKNAFVKVAAGQAAYVMVADLPKSVQSIDAPGDDELIRAASSLSDREVMELVLFGSSDEIRATMPLMTDEQKRLAIKTAASKDQEK